MAFHDVRFPVNVSLGSLGGPERRTEIVTTANGFEERNSPWAHSRRRYDAGVGMRSLDDVAEVIAFFEARMGRLHAFRWKDWADYKSCLPSAKTTDVDQELGRGDGSTRRFQLVKAYRSGGHAYSRPIRKPVSGTVTVRIGSLAGVEDLDWMIDTSTGEVELATAPGPGVIVSAGYEFDVPVRFDADAIQTSVSGFGSGDVPDVPLVEVRI